MEVEAAWLWRRSACVVERPKTGRLPSQTERSALRLLVPEPPLDDDSVAGQLDAREADLRDHEAGHHLALADAQALAPFAQLEDCDAAIRVGVPDGPEDREVGERSALHRGHTAAAGKSQETRRLLQGELVVSRLLVQLFCQRALRCRGWGNDRKIPLVPLVSVAGDVYNLGLGKLIALEGPDGTRLAVLSDTGGAFQPNLYQLDLLAGTFDDHAHFLRETSDIPTHVTAGLLVVRSSP